VVISKLCAMKTAQQWFEEILPKDVAEMAVKNIDKGKESI